MIARDAARRARGARKFRRRCAHRELTDRPRAQGTRRRSAARVDPDDDSEAARAANAEPCAQPTPRPRPQAAALDDVARERDGLFEELGELRLRHGHDAHSAQFNCARRTKGSALEAECAAWRRRGRGGGREDKERVLRRERDRREARGDAQKS